MFNAYEGFIYKPDSKTAKIKQPVQGVLEQNKSTFDFATHVKDEFEKKRSMARHRSWQKASRVKALKDSCV